MKALLVGLVVPLFAVLPATALSALGPAWTKLTPIAEFVVPLLPVVLFGLPAFLWRLRSKNRRVQEAWRVLGGWSAAAVASLSVLMFRY